MDLLLVYTIQVEAARTIDPVKTVFMYPRCGVLGSLAVQRDRISMAGPLALGGVLHHSSAIVCIDIGCRSGIADPFDVDFLAIRMVEEHA